MHIYIEETNQNEKKKKHGECLGFEFSHGLPKYIHGFHCLIPCQGVSEQCNIAKKSIQLLHIQSHCRRLRSQTCDPIYLVVCFLKSACNPQKCPEKSLGFPVIGLPGSALLSCQQAGEMMGSLRALSTGVKRSTETVAVQAHSDLENNHLSMVFQLLPPAIHPFIHFLLLSEPWLQSQQDCYPSIRLYFAEILPCSHRTSRIFSVIASGSGLAYVKVSC